MVVVFPRHALLEQQRQRTFGTILGPAQFLLDVVVRDATLTLLLRERHDLHVVLIQFGRHRHDHVGLPNLDNAEPAPQLGQFLYRDWYVRHAVHRCFLAVFLGPPLLLLLPMLFLRIQHVVDFRHGDDPSVLASCRVARLGHLDR